MRKRLLTVLCLLICLGILGLGVAAFLASVSPWSLGYLLGLFLIFLGLVLAGRLRLVSAGGLALMVVLALARLAVVSPTVIVLPEGTPSRLGALIEERDVSLMATRWGGPLRIIPRPELPGVHKAMKAAYREMGAAYGLTASPVVDTVLARNGPERFDAVVFDAPGKPAGALIFLHGYTGNFTLNCFLAARAAREAGLMTVCPSAGFAGQWWEADGAATVEATLKWLEGRGIKRIVLGGLSNGANGASALAPGLEDRLSGLLLVSGGFADARSTRLPVLAIHGRRDTMVGIERTKRYLSQMGFGPWKRLIEVPEGHFALLVRREELGQEITRWLQLLH
ncbi:MAG TPA: hypothetical protein VGK67_37345 [Myxococcales bacterium]